jgi:hypothetical protein
MSATRPGRGGRALPACGMAPAAKVAPVPSCQGQAAGVGILLLSCDAPVTEGETDSRSCFCSCCIVLPVLQTFAETSTSKSDPRGIQQEHTDAHHIGPDLSRPCEHTTVEPTRLAPLPPITARRPSTPVNAPRTANAPAQSAPIVHDSLDEPPAESSIAYRRNIPTTWRSTQRSS